jgi:hypothetical protein
MARLAGSKRLGILLAFAMLVANQDPAIDLADASSGLWRVHRSRSSASGGGRDNARGCCLNSSALLTEFSK